MKKAYPIITLSQSSDEVHPRTSFIIFSQLKEDIKNENHSRQLCLALESAQSHIKESSPYIQIASVPLAERIESSQHRYYLVIQPHGIRACGGQFTGDEAYQIANSTKGWDWSLDGSGRLRCLDRLEKLLDRICERSFQRSGSHHTSPSDLNANTLS